MKLRQKLAMVMAAAMIVTAVPVTTMAASTNSFNKTVAIVADQPITTGQGLELVVDYTSNVNVEDVFYLTATDFEFTKAAYGTGLEVKNKEGKVIYTVKWNSETELEVTVNAGHNVESVNIPVAGTPKKGTPAITVDATGSFATPGTLVLSGELTSDKALVATGADAKNISIEGTGTLADIIIEEKVAGALAADGTFTVKLPNSSDLNLHAGSKVKVEGKRGLSHITEAVVKEVDDKEITITVSGKASTRPGSIAISGIEVKPEDKREDVKLGDVVVTVKGNTKMDDTKLTLGKVAEAAVVMKVDEVDKITSGGASTTVKVTLEETVKDSIGKKDIYFTIDGADFASVTTSDAFTLNDKKTEITLDPTKVTDGKYEVEIEIAAKAATAGEIVITAEGRGLEEALTVQVAEATAPITVETEAFVLKAGVKDQQGGKVVITEEEAGKLARNSQIILGSEDFAIEDATVEVAAGDVKVSKSVDRAGNLIVTIDRSSDEASEIIISDVVISTNKALAEGEYDFVLAGDAIAQVNAKADKNEKNKLEDIAKDGLALEGFVTTTEAQQVVEIKEGPEVYLNEDNRMMAKLRVVAEAFGVEPSFAHVDGVGVITFFKDGKVVQFTNGSNIMNLNGVAVPMDTKTVIKEDGYTYVPARFLAEGLGLTVEWDVDARVATFIAK